MKSLFASIRKAHLIGIKGQGMTALAEMLFARGIEITGSDTSEVFTTDKVLRLHHIPVTEGFSANNIPNDADLIIFSTAYTEANNPEITATRQSKKKILSYPEAIGELSKEKLTLAVCGTHGKTTTSGLLAMALESLGKDPSAIVGSTLSQWKGNARVGNGDFLVLEADEYQDKLSFYHPFAVILTSADWDHPDFFPNKESYLEVFRRFVMRIPKHGVLVYCNDSADVVHIAEAAICRKISYGTIEGSEYHITEYMSLGGENHFYQSFNVSKGGEILGAFRLQLAGIHNALNATAVIALLDFLRVESGEMPKALASFEGTERRFEYIGERFGALVYDDFAHHPEEVRATLKAFRELYPKKNIRVVFHPHTFTRTRALFGEFAQCFENADEVHILPIYGSAREEHGGVSSEELVAEMNRFSNGKAFFSASKESIVEELVSKMGRNDVIITMGAGDVFEVGRKILGK